MRVNKLRMLTNEEIRMEIEEEMEKVGDPVQVVFANQKCLDCGQVRIPGIISFDCRMF